jgi:hypothetical protein
MKYQIVCNDPQIKSVIGPMVTEAVVAPLAAADLKSRIENALGVGVKVHVRVDESSGTLIVQRLLHG